MLSQCPDWSSGLHYDKNKQGKGLKWRRVRRSLVRVSVPTIDFHLSKSQLKLLSAPFYSMCINFDIFKTLLSRTFMTEMPGVEKTCLKIFVFVPLEKIHSTHHDWLK